MNGGQGDDELSDEFEEEKEAIFDQVASLETEDFTDFVGDLRGRPIRRILNKCYERGQLHEDERYIQLQDAYKKDPRKFLRTFPQDFGEILRNLQPNQPSPDRLPDKLAYDFMDKHEKHWLKLLRKKLGVEIPEQELEICRRNLTRRQKRKILEYWLSMQEVGVRESLETLRDSLQQHQQRRIEDNLLNMEEIEGTASAVARL